MRNITINDIPEFIPEIEVECPCCNHKLVIKVAEAIKEGGIVCTSCNEFVNVENDFEQLLKQLKEIGFNHK